MRFSRRVLFLVWSSAVFIFVNLAGISSAQAQTAVLSGVVTDPRGAVVAGAQITATQVPPPGEPQRTVSKSDGRFALNLAPGRYRVSIAHDSFACIEQDVTIAAGETRELPIRLSLEPLSAQVVVTAQALPLDAGSSPAPVTILTRSDIDQRVATSLPDLLATQPGFSLGRTGPEGGSTSLFLDGGNSNYTKVLIDGAPANIPGGLIDFSNLTVDNIDKIEIVHGAESALYGSDAMDGVIQIFTHRGATRIPEFTAFADGGNFSTGHGGAELSGLLGRFDYSAAVGDLETLGQGPNDGFRNRTLSGNFGWRFSGSSQLNLALRDNVSDAGIPDQTLLEPPSLYTRNALHVFTASATWKFATGNHWNHEVGGGEYYDRQHSFNPIQSFYATDPNAFCPQTDPAAIATAEFCDSTFDDRYQYNRANVSAQSTYLLRSFNFTGGYQYEVENGSIPFLAAGHVRRNNQGGFLDIRYQPHPRIMVSVGARAEANANFGTRVVPRVGVSLAFRYGKGFWGDTRYRAFYGQGIKEPRFDQLYSDQFGDIGNPSLKPEASKNLSTGIEQKLWEDRVKVNAEYFSNRFYDIISFAFCTPLPPPAPAGSNSCGIHIPNAPASFGYYFNTNRARARGANLSTEARFTRWLSAAANYTYDSTRVLSAPNNFDPNYIVGNRLIRRPQNSGSVMLNAAFWRMNWNLSSYFTGRRADSDFLGLGLTSNPGYARFDLAGSYNLTHGMSFYCRIANLADKHYQDVLGYPALGREFRIGVKYTTRHE